MRIATAMATGVLALVSARGWAEAPAPSPGMQAVLDQLGKLGGKAIDRLSPEEARGQPTPADAVQALLAKQGKSTEPEPIGRFEDRAIDGAAGKIGARIYWPQGAGPFPIVVYYHGGGWVIATNDTYDASARALANGAHCVVVAVEYRKAPEHKFPAAHEDAFAAYRWTLKNARSLGGSSRRVAVAGESAGGNLAAAVAIWARDRHVQMPVHQLLVYPIAGLSLDTPSYLANADAKPLNRAMMKWFLEQYAPTPGSVAELTKVRDLKNLPPATVITATIDPLQSEGKVYADRLRAAGVAVDYQNYDGVTHEFFGMAAVLDEARAANRHAAANLDAAFRHPPRHARVDAPHRNRR